LLCAALPSVGQGTYSAPSGQAPPAASNREDNATEPARLLINTSAALASLSGLRAEVRIHRTERATLPAQITPALLQSQKLLSRAALVAQGTLRIANLGKPAGEGGLAQLTLLDPKNPEQPRYVGVSDGKNLWRLYSVGGGDTGSTPRCVHSAIAPHLPARSAVGAAFGPLPAEVRTLFAEADPVAKWQAEGRLVSLSVTGRDYVEGTQCVFVTAIVRDAEAGVGGIVPGGSGATIHAVDGRSGVGNSVQDVTRVTFVLAERDYLVRQIVLERTLWNAAGEITVVSFGNLERVPLPLSAFAFTPPPGVTVVTAGSGIGSPGGMNGFIMPTGRGNFTQHPVPKGPSGTPPQSSALSTPTPAKPLVPSAPVPSKPIPGSGKPTGKTTEATKGRSEPVVARPSAAPQSAAPAVRQPSLPLLGTSAGDPVPSKAVAPNVPAVPVTREFGAVSLLDKRYIRDHFTVRNSTGVALRLDAPHGSCKCITATYSDSAGLPVVPPGGEATVVVTLDLGVLKPGAIHKTVQITATPADQPGALPQPLAQFILTGELKPAISVTPKLADVGQWRLEGQKPIGKPLVLTATFDPRLVTPEEAAQVQLVPVSPADKETLVVTALPVSADAKVGNTLTRQFRIEVRPGAPLGAVLSNLQFQPPAVKPIAEDGRIAWSTSTFTAVGDIRGDVTVSPSVINFGTVRPQGAVTFAVQKVVLTGEGAETLRGVKITSDNPEIQVKLGPETPTSQGANAQTTLEVTFQPKVSTGLNQERPIAGRIHVTLANGQRLVLPVMGGVEAASEANRNSLQPTTLSPRPASRPE
jgi:hypothetical protein